MIISVSISQKFLHTGKDTLFKSHSQSQRSFITALQGRERALCGTEVRKALRCKKATQKRKGPKQVKEAMKLNGPTEVQFKH